MTVTPCMPIEELATGAELPTTDPRRAHVAQCPRCGALLDAYARFIEPGAEADAPHVAHADARLSAFLARTIGAAPEAVRTPTRTSWWAARFAPAMRPAFGFVVAAIVLGGIVVWPRLAEYGPAEVLRGGSTDPNAPALHVRSAGLGVDGLHLAWNAVPGADAYEVRVYSERLDEIARLNANGDTVLTVSPSALPFRPAAGQSLLVRVDARARGELLASSPPTPLAVSSLPD